MDVKQQACYEKWSKFDHLAGFVFKYPENLKSLFEQVAFVSIASIPAHGQFWG